MASFPKLITPLTPGGLQSTALQQKPIDLSGILEAMQKDRLSKAAAAPKAKKGATDKYEIDGLEGAVDQAERAKISGQNDMADYMNRYGDLAFSLPQYGKAKSLSEKYYTPEYQARRARDKEMHDGYMKQLQEIDSTGTAPMTLYNLGELQKGSIETQARSAERLRNLGVDEKGTDAYKVYAHNWNTAQKAADSVLDPAFAAVNSYGSEDVKRFALDGDNVAGILKVGSSKSSNHSAMEVARAELYQDAGFHLDDKGNYIWRPTNTENPLQAGLLQEALKTLNVEGNEYFMKKDGSYDLDKIYEEGAKFAHNKLKLAVNKRLKQAEDNTKSYTQPTESEYAFGREQTAILAELAAPKHEMPKLYAIEDYAYSEDQIMSLLNVGNLNEKSGEVMGKVWDHYDKQQLIKEYTSNGIFTQQIDPASGKVIYQIAPNADNSLTQLIQKKNALGGYVGDLLKTQETIKLGNIAKAAPSVKINKGENHQVYIQTANELHKYISPRFVGQTGEVFGNGRVVDVGGTLGIFDFSGLKVANMGNLVMTTNGAAATNWQENKPFLVNGKIIYTNGFGDYDAKAGAYLQKPAEYKTDENGHIKRLTQADKTMQFAGRVDMAEKNKDNATGMEVHPYDMFSTTTFEPIDFAFAKKWGEKTKIQVATEVPIIPQRSLYAPELEEAKNALGQVGENYKKYDLKTGKKVQSAAEKFFDDNKFTEEQKQVIRATNDADAAARIAKVNKMGTNPDKTKNYPTEPLMASAPVYSDGRFNPNVVSEKTIMVNGKPETQYVITVATSVKGSASALASQKTTGNINLHKEYWDNTFKEVKTGNTKVTPEKAPPTQTVYGAYGRLNPNK